MGRVWIAVSSLPVQRRLCTKLLRAFIDGIYVSIRRAPVQLYRVHDAPASFLVSAHGSGGCGDHYFSY